MTATHDRAGSHSTGRTWFIVALLAAMILLPTILPDNLGLFDDVEAATPPVLSVPEKLEGKTNQPVLFDGRILKAESGQSVAFAAWDFGDGSAGHSMASITPVNHTYKKAGKYTATFNVEMSYFANEIEHTVNNWTYTSVVIESSGILGFFFDRGIAGLLIFILVLILVGVIIAVLVFVMVNRSKDTTNDPKKRTKTPESQPKPRFLPRYARRSPDESEVSIGDTRSGSEEKRVDSHESRVTKHQARDDPVDSTMTTTSTPARTHDADDNQEGEKHVPRSSESGDHQDAGPKETSSRPDTNTVTPAQASPIPEEQLESATADRTTPEPRKGKIHIKAKHVPGRGDVKTSIPSSNSTTETDPNVTDQSSQSRATSERTSSDPVAENNRATNHALKIQISHRKQATTPASTDMNQGNKISTPTLEPDQFPGPAASPTMMGSRPATTLKQETDQQATRQSPDPVTSNVPVAARVIEEPVAKKAWEDQWDFVQKYLIPEARPIQRPSGSELGVHEPTRQTLTPPVNSMAGAITAPIEQPIPSPPAPTTKQVNKCLECGIDVKAEQRLCHHCLSQKMMVEVQAELREAQDQGVSIIEARTIMEEAIDAFDLEEFQRSANLLSQVHDKVEINREMHFLSMQGIDEAQARIDDLKTLNLEPESVAILVHEARGAGARGDYDVAQDKAQEAVTQANNLKASSAGSGV